MGWYTEQLVLELSDKIFVGHMLDFDPIYNREIPLTDLHRIGSKLYTISHNYNVISHDGGEDCVPRYNPHYDHLCGSEPCYNRLQKARRAKDRGP